MDSFWKSLFSRHAFFMLVLLIGTTVASVASAAQLTLAWDDQSLNEDGFSIRRKTGTNGAYAEIATVAANVETYPNTLLPNSTLYCYRVFAYNTAGAVGSSEACAATSGSSNLSITKSDGVTTAVPGLSVTYTIVASNAGPDGVIGATVTDTFPATATCTWTCSGTNSGTCTASGSGSINDTAVNLPTGASVTYTASCTISGTATGTLVNTATVTAPGGGVITDSPGNNSATDTDTLVPCFSPSTLNPLNQVTGSAGGSAPNVTVTVPTACAWTAVSNVPWVTINSGSPGNGSGAVAYNVGVNPGPNPRRGTMTIAGKTFIVSQRTPVPAPCIVSVGSGGTFTPTGGTGNLAITAPAGCQWSAKSHVPWITITSATTGSGNGSVTYSVSSGGPRRGRITVNGKRVLITQN